MLDLQDRFDLVADILRASSDCIKVLDMDGRLIFMSEGGQRVMEIDDIGRFIGCPWPDFWRDEGNVAATHAIAEAKAGRHASFQGRASTAKGRERWWDVAVNPMCDANGAVVHILSISRDITDLKEAQNRQRLLMEELSHRVKNTLVMIKAIAARTLKDVSERAAVEAFDARLVALSGAHDLLLQESWSDAPMRGIVNSTLKLHGAGERISAAGPDVALGPRTSLHLALLLHELATNAIKYGALATAAGRVEVAWSIEAADSDRLSLQWRESGGTAVAQPARRGFGSRLIEMGLGAGTAAVSFDPGGVTASFRTPVDQLRF